MRITSAIQISFRALLRNKMRSALTALGIIIGVGAVIAMVSIGNGAKAQVEAQIASLGQNVIMIFAGNSSRGGVSSGWGSSGTLTVEDSDAILNEIPHVVNVSPEVMTRGQAVYGNQNWSPRISGESESYFEIRQWPFKEGGSFSQQDVARAGKVCVIGATVHEKLFGDSPAVGETIRVRDVPMLITGVLEKKGMSFMGSDQDDVIVVPYLSAMKRFGRTRGIRSLLVQVSDSKLMEATQDRISSLLRQRHRIRDGQDDDFIVHNQEEIGNMATQASKVMTLLLGAIASVSLVVGGIGIMNIMLVSVTERTREIGIRMAIGAHERDILLQFLIEAVSLSLIGGIVGVILGLSTSELVSRFAGWPTLISPSSIVLSLLFSAAIGVFFGFYPARKASRLEPIEALRYE